MPPHTGEMTPMEIDMHEQDIIRGAKPVDPAQFKERYGLMIFLRAVNQFAHILIGMIVAVCYVFAFRNGLPIGATPIHIVLCVTGYILLMAQAILSLSNQNGWSSNIKLVDKRRAHWILQILGSGLAISGIFYKILDKDSHWTTLHGRFALVALVFTSVSLVNGVASLWAYEVRRILPGNLSKITHICFGTVSFSAACITLCFGMDKGSFRTWIGNDAITHAFISFVAILAFIVIGNPLISFYTKTSHIIKK